MSEFLELTRAYPKRLTQTEARQLLDEVVPLIDPMSSQAAKIVPASTFTEIAKTHIANHGKLIGMSTGYPSLDKVIGGLDLDETSVWFGGTSAGKSQVTQNISLNLLQAGVPLLHLPLEMGEGRNNARLLGMMGLDKIDEFNRLPLYYPELNRMDIATLANTVEEAVSTYGIRVVVVDGLNQLVPRVGGNQADSISYTTDILHKIAVEHHVHIMMISHINRTGDESQSPHMSELKGSTSIAQDADMVVAVYRNKEDDEPSRDYYAPVKLTLQKDRNKGKPVYESATLNFQSNMRLTEPRPLGGFVS